MPVSSITRYVCDLAGCGFSSDDPAVQARFVKVSVHVDEGPVHLEGVYCSKAHAGKAFRDLVFPPAANLAAERERPAARAAVLARRPAKTDSRAAWNEYANALIEGYDADAQRSKEDVIAAVEAREKAAAAERRLRPAESDAGAEPAGRREAARRGLRV